MTHTPAPWVIGPNAEIGNPAKWTIGAAVSTQVPASASRHIANVYDGPTGDCAEANARLIAAAPELLQCLQKILAADKSGNNGMVMGEAVLCKYFSDMAQAAIDKALHGDKESAA